MLWSSICFLRGGDQSKKAWNLIPASSLGLGRKWMSVSLRDLRESGATVCQKPNPKPEMSHSYTLTSLHADIFFCQRGLHVNTKGMSHFGADTESFMCLIAGWQNRFWCFLSEYSPLTTTFEFLLMEKHAFDCS